MFWIYQKQCQAIFTVLYTFISFLNNYSAQMQKSYKSSIILMILVLILTQQSISCELGSIIINDICIKCQNIPNTVSSTKISKNVCICKAGYLWSKEARLCLAKQQTDYSIKKSNIEISNIFQQVSQQKQETSHERILQNILNCDSTNGFISYTQNRLKISAPSICINCLSLPFTLAKTLTNNTCTCQQSFYWPDQWPSCYCIEQSAINPQKKSCEPCITFTDSSIRLKCLDCSIPFKKSLYGCVNCLLLDNNGGFSSCCTTGFIFSFEMAQCVCDRSQGYSINSAGKCIKCSATDNDCLNCNNSYVFDNQQCKHGSLIPRYDFQTTFKCIQGLSFLSNPVTGQITSCSCSSSQGFYLNGNSCISCSSNLPSGITQIQCTSCSNSAGFYNSITQCILCSSLLNSLGTASINGCNCKDNYYWNTITSKCQCDYSLGFIKRNGDDCFSCTDAPNIGEVVLNTACSCAKGYLWNPTNYTCDCDLSSPGASFLGGVCFNCIGMMGSSGYFAGNNTACRCINGFFWNPARGKCQCNWAFNFAVFPDGFCKDCSQAAYSNGLATIQGCICINGLSWNPKTLMCTCSNGFVMVGNTCKSCSSAQLSTSATISDCRNCLNSKGFALLAGICYRCSSQTGASSTVSNNQCVCPGAGQVWRPLLGSCVCDWSKTYVSYLNPDNKTYTCQLCPYLKKDNTCACGTEFLLIDRENKICTDCQNDPNSFLDANYSCFCNDGYEWSQQLYPYRCVPKLKIGKGYFSSINNSYFSCSTLSNSLIESCFICNPALGFVLIPNTNQCLLCSSVLGSTGVATYNGCVCNTTREWDPISLTCDPIKCLPSMIYNALNSRCVCNPLNSILVNGNCVLCGSLANSNGFAKTTTQCGCLPPSKWVSTTQGGNCVTSSSSTTSCNITTSIVVNGSCFACPSNLGGLGLARNTTCMCSIQFYWLGNSTGGMCICNTTISYMVGTSCLACPAFSPTSFSTGLSDGKGGCGCINSTIWIVTNGIGRCSPCNMADNIILLSNGVCFICGTNNSYTNAKIISSSNNSCACQSVTLTWNPIGVCDCGSNSAMLIIGTTFSCFNCNNSTALTTSKATSTSCKCISSNLIWNETSRSCGCNNASNPNIIIIGSGSSSNCFDCIAYSLSIQASANRRSCICKGQLTWMTSSSTCDCQANQIMNGFNCITCSSLPYTSSAINKTTCSCLGTGLIFSSNGGCSCPSSSILLPNFTCLSCPTGSTPLTSYECLCILGSVWIYSSRTCRRCGTTDIPNSLPFGGSRMACQCSSNYTWDVMTQTCIISSICLTPSPSCMNCGAGLNATILTPSSARNLSQGATIQQMLNGTFTNYNILSAYQCPCAANSTWDALRLRCFNFNLQ